MAGPLVGLRVIDCTSGMAGAKAAGILADYGADVIWVEPPGGDPFRRELEVAYSVFNRSKRSITLNLQDSGERETLFGLLEGADVFIQSWQPGVADRLGVGYEAVHERNPALVYCSISGFGADSEHRDLPGHEALVHALLGTMGDQAGFRDGPIFVGVPSASSGAAYLGLIGILSSLYRRKSDGWGRHVETSLLDGMIAYVSQSWGYSAHNKQRYRTGGTRFYIKTLRCADDEYIGVHTAARGAFDRLMALVGIDDRVLPVDGSEASTPLSESEAIALAEIPGIFETQPRKVWLERLIDANICAIPVLRPTEVFDEPQAVHNEMVITVSDAALGTVQQIAPPIKHGRTPAVVRGGAPTVGQHTDEILAELRSGTLPKPPAASELGPIDERPLLAGLKVLDIGHWFAGPYASRLMADLGADVIKVEPPIGDPMRGLERPFSSAQAGKRAMGVDFRNPDVGEIRSGLIKWADVVHHNLRPGVAERLGMGYEQVHDLNPDVVYLHATGWGIGGPDVNRQSLAPLMAGYVGADYEAAGLYNPPVDPVANEDSGGGLLGAVGALMALWNRHETGKGQFLDSPHFHSAMEDMCHVVRTGDGTVLGAGRLDALQMGVGPLHRLYETADGWIVVVAANDTDIAALGRVLGVDILGDGRFATPQLREANAYELEDALFGQFLTRSTSDLLGELTAVGVPAAEPVYENNRRFMDDPENLRLGRVGEFDHPRYGLTRQPAQLIRFQGATVPALRRAPELGEHTDEILAAMGIPADEVASLRDAGAIR
ncbi:CaiB/BaiF CoA transferase family protein [Mycolicibacterium pyrenivorans]|uniref:CaiB/BaiF CoA transferase family protein n=1 Tax=Mycolicibacterium pyrenivorans TaxID=187102 RepID=UPI0021F3AE89|nr:CoA transferase [Mycolicibacterium pyrenivorans]